MISFKGELSDKAKKFVNKKHLKAAIILSIVESAIFSFPVVLLGILWDPMALSFLGVSAMIPVMNIVIWVYAQGYLTQIDFDNGIIYSYFSQPNTTEQVSGGSKDFDAVRAVVDYGDFYYLDLFVNVSPFVCQKDLLVEDTIEEFEALFADRLTRKQL